MYYSEFTKKLELAGIPPRGAASYEVVILPENIATFAKTEDLFQAVSATNLAKLLTEAGCRCASAYTFDVNVPALERRGSDKWLGCIWIRDTIAIPLVIGTLGSLIATHIHEAKPESEPTPAPPVHARIFIGKSDGDFCSLDYDGDGKTLLQMLGRTNDVRSTAQKTE